MKAASPHIFEGTRENFPSLVLENSARGPVLAYYWAPWAGPCHKFWPVLEKLAADHDGTFLLVHINTDEQTQLARDQGVRSVPTLKLVRHGRIVEQWHGPQPEAALRRALARYIAGAADAKLAEAIRTYRQGDLGQAVLLLREAEQADPDNPRIPVTLAKLLMRHGQHAEAETLLGLLPAEARQDPQVSALLAHLGFIRLARDAPPAEALEQAIAAAPGNCEARYRLSAVKLMQDDYEGALEQLLEILRRDRRFGDDAGRKGLVAVLDLLGRDSEVARRYRTLMSNAIR